MASIVINNFGGEIPRMSSRAKPQGTAEYSTNLLATSSEFRPVTGYQNLNVGVMDPAKTLYRTARTPSDDGLSTVLLTADSKLEKGWGSDRGDLSLVRGQLTDDLTERTYITNNGADGSDAMAPMVSAFQDGNSPSVTKRLGMPAPKEIEVTHNRVMQFTLADANTWVANRLVPDIVRAINASITSGATPGANEDITNRMSSTAVPLKTVAGVTAFSPTWTCTTENGRVSPRGLAEPWNAVYRIDPTQANTQGLSDPLLGGVSYNGGFWLAISAIPYWGKVYKESIKARLQASVNDPRDPSLSATLAWPAGRLDSLTEKVYALLDPDGPLIKAKRAALTQAMVDMSTALTGWLANTGVTRPTAPVNANGTTPQPPRYINVAGAETDDLGSGGYDGNSTNSTNPAYTLWLQRKATYDAAYEAYVRDLSAFRQGRDHYAGEMTAAQAKAEALTKEIEEVFADQYKNLYALVLEVVNAIGVTTLVQVDGDSLVDARFYFTTLVSPWGEESQPGPISDLLEVDQNDTVMITRPIPPTWLGAPPLTGGAAQSYGGHGIGSWRIYRSNSGATATAFQLVADVPWNTKTRAPITTGYDDTGWNGIYEWQDIVASRVVMMANNGNKPTGYVTGNGHLVAGDKVKLTNKSVTPNEDYEKYWSGTAWVSSAAGIVTQSDKTAYIDGLKGADLGEVCPTTTWAPPPAKLRGLVALPNGVMAGFVDNYVCFSEPYVPHAWPVAYQIPIEFQIVGLGVFGQSLFVGTAGNPYIISGSDPASMSAQRLDVSQSCVSRRSIVSAGGGVFYASPDGYCLADNSGVRLLTQELMANEDWRLLNPATIFAAVYDNVLYFWCTVTQAGAFWPYLFTNISKSGVICFALDFTAKKLTRVNYPVTAVFNDIVTDSLYGTYNGNVYRLFSPNGGRSEATWSSSVITLPKPASLGWLQVWGDQCPATSVTYSMQESFTSTLAPPISNAPPTGEPASVAQSNSPVWGNEYGTTTGMAVSIPGQLAVPVTITVWARETPTPSNPSPQLLVRYKLDVTTTRPVRLPSGVYSEYMIQVTSKARITQVALVSTMEELKQL